MFEIRGKVLEEYAYSLLDLTTCSKLHIDMLTLLADDNITLAPAITNTIENHVNNVRSEMKVPALCLIDSIIKNAKKEYRQLFSAKIGSLFWTTFVNVDTSSRSFMYKLRKTWTGIFPERVLYALDIMIHLLDKAWPITAPVPPLEVTNMLLKDLGIDKNPHKVKNEQKRNKLHKLQLEVLALHQKMSNNINSQSDVGSEKFNVSGDKVSVFSFKNDSEIDNLKVKSPTLKAKQNNLDISEDISLHDSDNFGEILSIQSMIKNTRNDYVNVPVPELYHPSLSPSGVIHTLHETASVNSKDLKPVKRLSQTELHFKAPKLRKVIQDNNVYLCADQTQDENCNAYMLGNSNENKSSSEKICHSHVPKICNVMSITIEQSITLSRTENGAMQESLEKEVQCPLVVNNTLSKVDGVDHSKSDVEPSASRHNSSMQLCATDTGCSSDLFTNENGVLAASCLNVSQPSVCHSVENHGPSVADLQLFWTKFYGNEMPNIQFSPSFRIYEGGVNILSKDGGPITDPVWVELPPFYKITCSITPDLKKVAFFDLLRKHVGNFTLIGYTSTNRLAEFYLDCSSMTYQLHSKKKYLEKDKIQVRCIEPVFSIVPVLSEDLKSKLTRTILSSWMPESRTLDLEQFHRKPDLISTNCCPVYEVAVFKFIAQYVDKHLGQLNKLKLNMNKIRSLEFLKAAEGSLITNVDVLDLSGNEIREYSELSHIQSYNTTYLYLQQNRLVWVDFDEYASSVRRYLPQLQKLDSISISKHQILRNENTDLAKNKEREQKRGRKLIKEVLKPFIAVEQGENRSEEKDTEKLGLEEEKNREESELVILEHYNFLNPKVKAPLVDLVDESDSEKETEAAGETSATQTKKFVLPCSQKMFFCTQDPKVVMFVVKFVHDYIEVYDSRKRDNLAKWYTDWALFSLTTFVTDGSSSYEERDRNLKMMYNRRKKFKKLCMGRESIIKMIRGLPLLTKHFGTSFSIDLLCYTDHYHLVSFCGIFEETRKGNKIFHRSFKRVFMIVREGIEHKICNEELFLADVTPEQAASKIF